MEKLSIPGHRDCLRGRLGRPAEIYRTIYPPRGYVFTLVTYLGALYFLTLTVRTMPVGVAYALWAGTGMVLIALLGVALHKEQLDLPAVIGLVLILAGVLIINLFSKSISH